MILFYSDRQGGLKRIMKHDSNCIIYVCTCEKPAPLINDDDIRAFEFAQMLLEVEKRVFNSCRISADDMKFLRDMNKRKKDV